MRRPCATCRVSGTVSLHPPATKVSAAMDKLRATAGKAADVRERAGANELPCLLTSAKGSRSSSDVRPSQEHSDLPLNGAGGSIDPSVAPPNQP